MRNIAGNAGCAKRFYAGRRIHFRFVEFWLVVLDLRR